MEETIKLNGANLHVIKTNKFKNTLITIKFKSILNRETTSTRALLSMCLLGGTAKLKTQQELASYLESCYGANLSSNVSTKGKAQIIHLTSSFVNEKFLPTSENLFKKQVDLMHDILFNPLYENNMFTQKVVMQKKRELHDRLKAIKDDKFSYALDKTLEIMGENSILGICGVGYEEDIDAIECANVTNALNDMLLNDTIEIYIIGDLNEQHIDYFKSVFNFENRKSNYEASYIFKSSHNEVIERTEAQDITQAKYNMAFRANVDFLSNQHEAMTITNGILGAFSHSCLFKNVREKHSLCYYISSTYDAFNGIIIVSCGIEGKEANRVKKLVMEQIKDLQQGHISDEEIEITKRMFENSLRKSQDEAGSIIGLRFNRDIVQKKETIDDYLTKLMAVSKEDIIECANLIELDTTFLLKGSDNDAKEILPND